MHEAPLQKDNAQGYPDGDNHWQEEQENEDERYGQQHLHHTRSFGSPTDPATLQPAEFSGCLRMVIVTSLLLLILVIIAIIVGTLGR